jgi:hypothetical protein
MALNTVSLRSSLSGYLQLFANRRDVSTENLNRHNDMVRKVDAVVEEVATKQQAIVANRTLSDEGKATQLATLATATASKLGFLERVVSSLEDDRRQTEATLFTIKAPVRFGTDAQVQYANGLEIRREYKGLSQNKRDAAFVIATQGGGDADDAILWALQQAPVPMVTKEIMKRALDERARRLNPETWTRLQQVTMLHESLAGLRDSLVDWLNGLGGDPKKIFDELGGAEPTTPPIDVARRMVSA